MSPNQQGINEHTRQSRIPQYPMRRDRNIPRADDHDRRSGNIQEKAQGERRQNEPRQDALSVLGKNENGIGNQRAGHNDRSGDQNWIQFRVSLPEQIRAMPPNALLTCVLAGASLATARVVTAK